MTNLMQSGYSFEMTTEEKERLRKIARRVNAEAGIPERTANSPSAREIRERMIAEGVRPEDNSATSELLRMRACEIDLED